MLLAPLNAAQGFVEGVLALKILLDIMESGRPFGDALLFMLVFFGFGIVLNLLNNFASAYINPRGQEKLNASMNRILYDKAAALDLSCYDSPEFYDDFVWGVSEANPKINAILDNAAHLIKAISTAIMTGALFILLDWVGLGYNGAGKTTLAKLLMRLYDPTEGEILLAGVNINEYDLAKYRRKIGAVFQDYQIFAAPTACRPPKWRTKYICLKTGGSSRPPTTVH